MSVSDAVVQIEHVFFSYPPQGSEPVLEDVTLEIGPRDFLGIIGPNGGGKTTIVRTALGAVPLLAGRLVGRKPLRIGYVPQRATAGYRRGLAVNLLAEAGGKGWERTV